MNASDLHPAFLARMRELLGTDADAFFASFAQPAVRAFHLNTTREADALRHCLSHDDTRLGARPYPAVLDAYFYTAERIGSHPLHHAGLIYAQDPAAMLPAACARVSERMRILDLCAAPGGKTSMLARATAHTGALLIANEPHPARNRILRQNVERMGYPHIQVTQCEPEELAALCPAAFDLVLVDAPCSGEGMFRKYPESISEWSPSGIARCAERQSRILDAAALLCKPGGQLIYSTCTYAPEENEAQLSRLINNGAFSPLPIPSALCEVTVESDYGSRRFYPHLHPGEGQFFASLQKAGSPVCDATLSASLPVNEKKLSRLLDAARAALEPDADLSGLTLYEQSGTLYVLPPQTLSLPSKMLTLPGVALGALDTRGTRGERFLPHHHFFRAYPERFRLRCELSPDAPALAAYLHGEELRAASVSPALTEAHGYGVIVCLGAGVGGFRLVNGRLKNLYPKGLRQP